MAQIATLAHHPSAARIKAEVVPSLRDEALMLVQETKLLLAGPGLLRRISDSGSAGEGVAHGIPLPLLCAAEEMEE